MEKDKECVLDIKVFTKYWKQLLLNYNKKHTQEKFKLYYSIFKNTSEEDLKIAIRKTIEQQPYFPNVNEIYRYLPTKEDKIQEKLKSWENVKAELATDEEIEELKDLLKEFK